MKKSYILIVFLGTFSLAVISYLVYNSYHARKESKVIFKTLHKYKEEIKRHDSIEAPIRETLRRARRVQAISDSFFNVIESWKQQQESEMMAEVRYDLKKLVIKTSNSMLALVEIPADRDSIKLNTSFMVIDMDDTKTSQKPPLKVSRAMRIALLTKIQNDCRSLETDILTSLAKSLE